MPLFIPEIFAEDEILTVRGQAADNALGPEIRLLVWNVYKAKRRTWPADFQKLTHDRNLALLQESVLNTRHDTLFERLEWVMARSHRNTTTLAETGVKTGCAAASIDRRIFRSPDREPVFNTPKMMLATTYALTGRSDRLLVLNMHAINFVSLKKYARQIAQIAEAVHLHDGPVILAGDFNTWKISRHRLFAEAVQRAGLRDIALDRKTRLRHLGRHLDHIFYRGLILKEARAWTDIKSSDHEPMTAVFSLSLQEEGVIK